MDFYVSCPEMNVVIDRHSRSGAESPKCIRPSRLNRSNPRKNWVNPFTAPLQMAVERRCIACDCVMDSWDAYYDHFLFDQDHRDNELRFCEQSPRPSLSPLLPDRLDYSSQKTPESSSDA